MQNSHKDMLLNTL